MFLVAFMAKNNNAKRQEDINLIWITRKRRFAFFLLLLLSFKIL